MKKICGLFFLFALIAFRTYAQNPSIQKYIEQGIALHDKGDFDGALDQYKKAVKIEKDDPLLNYEMASTYFAMKNYEKAIEHCDIVILTKSPNSEHAYVIKGSAYDMMGKPKDAIATYKKGVRDYPKNYLLYFKNVRNN